MMRRLAVGAPIISKSIQSTTSLETLKGSNMRFKRLITMRLASKILSLCALLVATCEGPVGPNGPTGTPGPVGTDPLSCEPSATGLHAELSLSPPAQGAYYKTGEAPQLTIRLLSGCQKLVAPSDLGTANLYLVGPRGALTTRSANQLLNAVTDRAAKDRQHHFINLKSPSYANPSAGGLKIAQDGTLLYQLSPITSETAGTYTVGLWAKSTDEQQQIFPLLDFQIGTATAETYASGDPQSSSCAECHKGPDTGKLYMHHIAPGFSPLGNWALDQFPIATCKLCHNQDGYSPNTTVRKVHAVHRGEHQLRAGAAHPEYGVPADASLALYLNVGFPAMPDLEKDCSKCHRDERNLKQPSRQACGACHDALFFDTGTLNPVRQYTGACVVDADCASKSSLAKCNTAVSLCETATHPKQSDDSQCSTCHSSDTTGISPIPDKHDVVTRTRIRKIKLSEVSVSGGSGPLGAMMVGDIPRIGFKLLDGTGAPITDLKTNAALSGTLLIGGPTNDRQMVFPSISIKTGTGLVFDATSNVYTYTHTVPWPANAQTPLNSTGLTPRPNPAGTYSAWLYVVETSTYKGASVRDVGTALIDFRVGGSQAIRPRHVITRDSCNSCHVIAQAHGGSRRDAEGCSICHTAGAVDRTVGARGVACTTNAQCGGAAAGWESCQDTNADTKLDTCVLTVDPTPGQTILFSSMIHSTHYARRLGGYAERSSLVKPFALTYIGNSNRVNDFSEILFPQDIRNCSKCHGDSGASCSASMPCGIGQSCQSGKCKNVAYQDANTAACLGCHDTASAAGHAALNTWTDPMGKPVETCEVCHGATAEFAVSKVHNISSPYKPPYSREKE